MYHKNCRRKKEAKKSVKQLGRTLTANPEALILAFDLEVYEHDHSIILEIGYVMTTLDNQEDMQTFHYIIRENLRYANLARLFCLLTVDHVNKIKPGCRSEVARTHSILFPSAVPLDVI